MKEWQDSGLQTLEHANSLTVRLPIDLSAGHVASLALEEELMGRAGSEGGHGGRNDGSNGNGQTSGGENGEKRGSDGSRNESEEHDKSDGDREAALKDLFEWMNNKLEEKAAERGAWEEMGQWQDRMTLRLERTNQPAVRLPTDLSEGDAASLALEEELMGRAGSEDGNGGGHNGGGHDDGKSGGDGGNHVVHDGYHSDSDEDDKNGSSDAAAQKARAERLEEQAKDA